MDMLPLSDVTRKTWTVMLFVIAVLLMPVLVYAQPPTPDPGQTSPFAWYTSVTGVVAATLIGVSILKRALGNISGLNAVPTWLYAVIISSALTFFCVHVWGTLPGELWQTLVQAVMMAAAASGFYDWLNNPTTSLAVSAAKAGVVVDSK